MDYRELAFYQKGRMVTQALNAEIKTWPKSMPAQEIARQLFRASTSVGANIAEGHGRHVGQEYIHFLTIAQGSAIEADHWLNTALDCGIGNPGNIRQILSLNTETRKMLSAAINSLRNHAANSIHETPPPYSPIPFSDPDDNPGVEIP
ncbi:MAG TPA: four helix bundle protein [Anaerolineales bacterium]|nr:four helix bundle protein [Anaerolineales bacterium]